MAEYIDRNLIEWYGCDFEGEICYKYQCNCSKCTHGNCDHDEVMNIPLANVIEREKIDKAIKEMEINLIGLDVRDVEDKQEYYTIKECIEILKKNIGE